MEIKLTLNGRSLTASIGADTLLIDFVRDHGCYSASSAGARPPTAAFVPYCWTVRLYCPAACCAARVAGRRVQTLEGLQEEAGGLCRLYCRPGRGAVRLLQPGLCDEHHRAAPGESTTRPTTRSAPILRATCAAAPAMRGNCAASERIWTAGRRRRAWSENRFRVVNQPVRKKDAMQLLLGQARLCGRRDPAGLPGGQGAAQPPRPRADRGDRYGHCAEGAGHRVHFHLEGCAAETLYHGGADLPGAVAPTTGSSWTGGCALWETRWRSWPGENEEVVDQALKLIKVKYQVLEPCWTSTRPRTTRSWCTRRRTGGPCCPVGADNRRNLCASDI